MWGRSYSSVGRAGVSCCQRLQVQLLPVTHLLHVIPSLSAPFPVISSAVPVKLKAKAQKIIFKKKRKSLTTLATVLGRFFALTLDSLTPLWCKQGAGVTLLSLFLFTLSDIEICHRLTYEMVICSTHINQPEPLKVQSWVPNPINISSS